MVGGSTMVAPLGTNLRECCREIGHDISKRGPKAGRARQLHAPMTGVNASMQVCLAHSENVPPALAEMVPDKAFEALWRPAQQVEHGPESEQESVLIIGQLLTVALWSVDQALIAGLVVEWQAIEDEGLDGDDDLKEA